MKEIKKVIAYILAIGLTIFFGGNFVMFIFIQPIKDYGWYGLLFPLGLALIIAILVLLINFISNNINE